MSTYVDADFPVDWLYVCGQLFCVSYGRRFPLKTDHPLFDWLRNGVISKLVLYNIRYVTVYYIFNNHRVER